MRAFFDQQDGSAGAMPISTLIASRGLDRQACAIHTDTDSDSDSDSDSGSDTYFDLGIMLSTGTQGQPCDLVEAHKWFNIAASAGHPASAQCRADLALEMTARDIADAQRRAREWLRGTKRPAALTQS